MRALESLARACAVLGGLLLTVMNWWPLDTVAAPASWLDSAVRSAAVPPWLRCHSRPWPVSALTEATPLAATMSTTRSPAADAVTGTSARVPVPLAPDTASKGSARSTL